MAFWQWSKTASSNANDDSTINWAEGMAPSAVNDSARAMMARLREWGSDIAGSLVDTGTSTAFAVTSNQGFDTLAHMAGAVIAFVPANTNTGASTLAVDGLTAKPLRSAPSVEIASGTLVAGTPYVCTYNNSDGAFYLQNFFVNPFQVPLGVLMPYIGSSAPNSAFALPYGQAVSRTTYATLFSLCGTTFGTGDGTTTFNIPDLRGRVTAYLDNMGGAAASRIPASLVTDSATIDGQTLGSVGGSASHAITAGESAALVYTASVSLSANQFTAIGPSGGSSAFNATGSNNIIGSGSVGGSATVSTNAGGGAHAMLQPTIMLNCILRII